MLFSNAQKGLVFHFNMHSSWCISFPRIVLCRLSEICKRRHRVVAFLWFPTVQCLNGNPFFSFDLYNRFPLPFVTENLMSNPSNAINYLLQRVHLCDVSADLARLLILFITVAIFRTFAIPFLYFIMGSFIVHYAKLTIYLNWLRSFIHRPNHRITRSHSHSFLRLFDHSITEATN